jgi:hypothetical protein
MAAESIGSVFLELRADATKLKSDVSKSMTSAASLIKKHSDKIAFAAKAVAAGAAAATASIVALTKAGLDSVDAMAKTADKLNISTQALAGFQHAAGLAGVQTKALETGLAKMADTVADAANGMAAPALAFEQLGLNAAEVLKLPIDEQFRVIAEEISKVDNAAKKIQLSRDIFGRGGVDLIPLLNSGAQGLAAMQREAERLGLTFSRFDAAKVEEANDNMARLGMIIKGVSRQFGIEMAPAIAKAAQELLTFNEETGAVREMAKVVGEIGKAFTVATAAVVDFFSTITANVASAQAAILGLKAEVIGLAESMIKFRTGLDVAKLGFGNQAQEIADQRQLIADRENYNIKEREFNRQAREEFRQRQADAAKAHQENVAAASSLMDLGAEMKSLVGLETVANGDAAAAEVEKVSSAIEGIPPLLERVDTGFEKAFEVRRAEPIANSLAGMRDRLQEIGDQLDFAEIGSASFERLTEESDKLNYSLQQVSITHESAFSKMQRKTEQTAQSFQRLTSGLGQNLSQAFQTGEFKADSFLNTIKAHFADLAVENIKTMLGLQKGTADGLTGMSKQFSGWFKWLTSAFSGIGSWIGKVLGGIGSWVGSLFSGGSSGGGGGGGGWLSAIGSVVGMIFEGGGYTGDGSRAGGMDGKGGFLAMMHPQETVIDHTKMTAPVATGGSGSNIVVNLTQNYDPSLTEPQVAAMIEQNGALTVAGIFEAFQSGGGARNILRGAL